MFARASAQLKEMVAKASPFGRIATVDDIADSVALIASESGRWISAQAILVNGGAK
jgi:NAD(P)-dependent dehydrogenase (short-subunit alcohol dehydrogenase family)